MTKTQEQVGELLCPADFIFVSVSQAKNWDRCNRGWGFDKIDLIKRITSAAQQFGLTGHGHAQRWQDHGTMPPDTPEGKAFKQGIKKGWLPPPKSANVHTEVEFARPMHEIADDLLFIGYIDIVDARDKKHVIVQDHKFTKDLRYAMEEAELAEDLQAIGYARIVFDETEAQKVTCRWNYYAAAGTKTRKPKGTKKVEHTFDRGVGFEERWQEFVEISREIYDAKNNCKKASDLDPNPGECGAFGGCQYAEKDPKTKKPYCIIKDESRFRAHFAQFEKTNKRKAKAMGGLFDKVKNKKEKADATTTPEPATSPREPVVEPEAAPAPAAKKSGGLMGKFEQLAAASKGKKVALAGKAKLTTQTKAAVTNAAMSNDGVNPPEQHQASGDSEPAPETAAEKKKREGAEKRAAKKAEKEAAKANEPKPSETNGKADMTVFIDCLPVKGVAKPIQLIDILAPSMGVVADKIKEPHWNLAEFAKGGTLLATAFDQWLDDNPVVGVVLMDSSSAESRAVREVLVAHAKHVVQGVG